MTSNKGSSPEPFFVKKNVFKDYFQNLKDILWILKVIRNLKGIFRSRKLVKG